MFSRLDDIVALAGCCCVLAGVYLWLGLAAALIVTGAALIYVGARIQPQGKPAEPTTTPPIERRAA